VVGAGPVGLATAIDSAQRGIPVVLFDDDDSLSTGSRAICFAKRTLAVFNRLGCGLGRLVQLSAAIHEFTDLRWITISSGKGRYPI
jgi:2-polyprenyl-6-methoxyphenol hydroxylase-like FAD-dependent oxidoreductase